jgi:hypothetical protein
LISETHAPQYNGREFNISNATLDEFLFAGMQKLIYSSEGVRESLRRLSSISWMAEELHKVADYYLPNKSVSTRAHPQVAELIHLGPSFSPPPPASSSSV